MTDQETTIEENTERPERAVFRREFSAQFAPGEGRTVDVRIVPYGERITHNDGLGGVPKGVEYREEFLPGVFDHQIKAPFRIHANVEHEQGVGGKVAHGTVLRSEGDGFYGTFQMLDTPAGETALQLIRAGSLDGVSVEAQPVKSIKSAGGVVQRAKANLFGIAFTRFAAYSGARVLAVREEMIEEHVVPPEFLPTEIDARTLEFCRARGIDLPERYQAHPDETDTSADADTSEDGTRQTTDGNQLQED